MAAKKKGDVEKKSTKNSATLVAADKKEEITEQEIKDPVVAEAETSAPGVSTVSKPVKIKPRKIIGHEAKTNRWGYVFVLPFLLAFMIFNLWPTINTFVVSFTDMRGLRNDYVFSNAVCPSCSAGLPPTASKGRGFTSERCQACEGRGKIIFGENEIDCEFCQGLGSFQYDCNVCNKTGLITPVKYNYSRLIKDQFFWGALGNTFIIWGLNFIPQLGLALILAIWLSDTRLNLVGKGLFRAVIYLPNLLTAASVAILFRTIFGFGGHAVAPANQFLRGIGFIGGDTGRSAIEFFRSVPFARGLTAFIQWWMWYGHTLILLMAGITSIPTSLYESAVVDGANSRQTSWYITLPLLRPMMLFILVTSMIGGMQMFDIPFLLTNGQGIPNYKIRTTVVYQYNVAFFMGASDRSYGATISIGIFIITVILAILIFFFLQDRSELKKRKIKGGVA